MKEKVAGLSGIIAIGLLAGSAATAAQEERTEPTWVTGDVDFAPSCSELEAETRESAVRQSDFRCEPQTWTSSDPRLGGPATVVSRQNVYAVGDEVYSVYSEGYDVRGESGGWRCSFATGLVAGDDISFQPDERLACVGYGDNTGLSAILIADFSVESTPRTVETFNGLIFPGDPPPVPDLSAAE